MDQAKVATSLTNLGFCPKTVSPARREREMQLFTVVVSPPPR
jgi:hypothetical protein